MSTASERLYALLPAVYRERDAAQGHVLRSLIELIGEQVTVLEDDLDQLYDDLFIETCADWVIPYLGALVGVTDPAASRAEVANTLAYRRRKGTATVIEQLASDITGWDTLVIEYFQRLATTQYLNHLRPAHRTWIDVRRPPLRGTAFDASPRTAEMRRIEPGRGRYNIANIGIHSWRIPAFEQGMGPAQRLDARRFRFDVLGRDLALYNRPLPEPEISYRAEPWNVPMPLTRELLADHPDRYFGISFAVEVDGEPVTPAAGQEWLDLFSVCNLMDFAGSWANLPADRIAIDPELGRLAFPSGEDPPGEVRLMYHYGFPGRIGGGTYPRQEGFSPGAPIRVPEHHTSIQAALDAAVQRLTTDGSDDVDGVVVEITDNAVYAESLQLNVPAGRWIELRAAEGRRPALALGGDFELAGDAGAEVRLDGLLVAGGAVRVAATVDGAVNDLERLRLQHCTLVPASNALDDRATPLVGLQIDSGCGVLLHRCVCSSLRLVETASVEISDSIVDAGATDALAVARDDDEPAGDVQVRASTLVGRLHATTLSADDTIFHAAGDAPPVRIERVQQGCVRFSWVPSGSIVPRRYRCRPSDDDGFMHPYFTSLVWGDAGYGQLSARCATAIREGAEDGGEMGAFEHLKHVMKSARLRRNLPEYLRLSLEAGPFLET